MKTPDAKRWRSVAFTSKERRNYLRFPFSAEILIQTFGLRAAIQARTTNLGQLGCGVETDHPLPLGSVVKIRICTISSTLANPVRKAVTFRKSVGLRRASARSGSAAAS
jgi:hypothetical protein